MGSSKLNSSAEAVVLKLFRKYKGKLISKRELRFSACILVQSSICQKLDITGWAVAL